MNAIELTDDELYEISRKVLTDKLGASQVQRFIRQCKPGKGDYSVDRHKLLADQPDIDTIVKRIQKKRTAWEAEERARTKRFSAPQSEIRKMPDIEIYEIGSQVLVNKLGAAGSMQFIGLCQEINGGYSRERIENTEEAEEFIKLYTVGLTLYPKMVEGYIKRGNAYSYIGKYDKAIADYSEAIKLKPNYAKAYYNRGNAYRDHVNFDRAIADYTKAIELNPNHAEAYYNRGKLYAEAEAYDKAIKDFSAVIKLEPKHADAYGCRGTLYSEKDEYGKAIEDFSIEIKRRPDDAETYYDRGKVYGKKGEYDKAIEDCSKAIELNPEFPEVYATRALAYFHTDKFECAIQDYDKVLELKPKFTEVYAARGVMWLHVKEWESAKLDLTFARNLRVNIINIFHTMYESIEDFEQKNDIQLPEDIAAMLRRQ
jgi:tetratricopeptide (TPR) repeat protein